MDGFILALILLLTPMVIYWIISTIYIVKTAKKIENCKYVLWLVLNFFIPITGLIGYILYKNIKEIKK